MNKKIKTKIFLYLLPAVVLVLAGFLFNYHELKAAEGDDDATSLNQDIKDLNSQIDERQKKIDELEEKVKLYEANIKKKQGEALSLQSQVGVLEDDIAKKETSIESSQNEIELLNLQIETLELKIQETQEKIEREKESLKSYLNEIYTYSQQTYLEVAVNYSSFSEYFKETKYLEDVQGNLQGVLDKIVALKESLDEKVLELDGDRKKVEETKNKLELEKSGLESEKNYAQNLIDDIKQDEDKFQALVNSVRKEIQNSDASIVFLEKQLREKIKQRQSLLNGNSNTNTNDDNPTDLLEDEFSASWPVASRLITAYFHDSDYPFKRWFEHSGVDVAVGQGTSIKSVAPGYVAIAKDAGLGYSYIMIVHADGYSSVYGHVSRIDVEPEQYVARGEVIGASGGTPGMPGTGSFSTGPHLHFEIRLNGIPVDPLNYLP